MFTDDQFTKYVNGRFPAIDNSRQRKTIIVEPPRTPIVLLAPVVPNSDNPTVSADKITPPLSQAA